MASETIGTARVDIVVDTAQFDTAVQAAKRSVSDMSTSAQQAYNQLDKTEKRRVDRLINQANTIGFTREQQIAYNAALKTNGPILDEITRKLARNQTQAKAAGIEFNKYGISAKQNAAALRQVPAQLTDIFVGLQGGQNPLTVLLQQGGQLKDVFGGVVPAARALGGAIMGLINPFTLGAAAIAGFFLAFEQGRDQMREFEKSLILTGNVAGTSAEELAGFAKELDSLSGVTQREASAVLAEVASTGQFTAEQIMLVARAALQMREATGREISATIADFAKLKKDPAEAIAALSLAAGDGTNAVRFLTQEQNRNIQSLEEQGKETEATQAAFEALAGAIDQRAPQITAQMGALEAAFRGVKNGAGELWDEFVQGMNEAADELERQSIGPFGNFLRYFGRRGRGTAVPAAAGAGSAIITPEQLQADKERKEAEEAFGKLVVSNLSKREKLEREIKEIRELGLKAGKSEAVIEQQIAQARARYAESLPKGRKTRSETDPTDAILARIKQQIALNEEQAKSEATLTTSERLRIQVLQQLEELGAKATPARRAEIEALLDQAVASGKLVEQQKAEAQAKKDLSALTAQLAVAERNYRLQVDADLMSIGRGADAVEMLRRQLDLQRELEDGLDSIRRDSAGKSREALAGEEAALRESIERRLNIERDYQMRRQEMMGDWRNGARAALEDYTDGAKDVAGQTYEVMEATFAGLEDVFVDFFQNGKADWEGFLDDINAMIFRFIARQQLAKLAEKFLPGLSGDSEAAELTSAAGALAASAAPLTGAAAALSAAAAALAAAGLASAGAGGGAASGGGGWASLISSGLSALGYADGGYTGDGPMNQPAGIVHRGEYVLNAGATRAMGRGVLDKINSGQQVAPVVPASNFSFYVQGSIDNRSSYRIALDTMQAQRAAAVRA